MFEILDAPMADWPALYDALTTDQRREVDDQAAVLAVKAARLSRYFGRRTSGGKHEDAVKAQNSVAAKVRQALGFTYKDSPITF